MTPTLPTQYDTFRVKPLSPTIGAEVQGFRMHGEHPDSVIKEIRQALLDWKVIFFREQDVPTEDHIAFGRRFGELEIHPFATNHPDHPEIVVIHHSETSKYGQNNWHSDVTWRLEPSLGSILRGIVIPPVGGDTLFADMYAAFDGLSDEVKEKLDGAVAEHNFLGPFGYRMDEEEKRAQLEKYPPAQHPVIRTHPETGRKGIYVNSAFTIEILEMEKTESDALLKKLYRQAAIPEYQCRFRWEENSVAFWDNRAVQHYAAFDYPGHARRVERVTIVGDKPF